MTTVDSKSVGRFDQKLAAQRLFPSLSCWSPILHSTYHTKYVGTPALAYIRSPNPLASKLRFCLVHPHMMPTKTSVGAKRGGASWGDAASAALSSSWSDLTHTGVIEGFPSAGVAALLVL
jgi:hypothetical protein